MAEDTSKNAGANRRAMGKPPEHETAGKDRTKGKAKEIGGRKGPDPTRYGDWEKDGRCIDF